MGFLDFVNRLLTSLPARVRKISSPEHTARSSNNTINNNKQAFQNAQLAA